MKYTKIFLSAAMLFALGACSKQAPAPAVIPQPASIEQKGSAYQIPDAPMINIAAPVPDSERLMGAITEVWPQAALKPDEGADISLSISPSLEGVTSPEGYTLSVTDQGVAIEALDGAGLFYGLQTLAQMNREGQGLIPGVVIVDEPRMEYRGLMLDISRHYRDADFIKKQIDAMAQLKLNRLHLHLTDAAGWRIEIKKYPRLTEYAAWRPEETWKEWGENGHRYCNATDSTAHGGFLTQDEVRDIVAYAADRYITVIPEIEMPSHSGEVLAAYPELGCVPVADGQDFCVGNEKTYEFLQDVIDEVIDLFPSHYIHIGGDEAGKQGWRNCTRCQRLMRQKGLKDVDELQSYLITRMEEYVNSKGRDIIGWDEIMEGGLAPNATVMSWRGTEGGIRAAHGGHKAIMSPGAYCYLDGYQDAPSTQPQAIGGYLPLEKVYSYNPVPDTLASDVKPMIIGVQGNLWCEYIPTAEHAEYMIYPRLLAIAEIGWTPQEERSWADFKPRAEKFNEYLASQGYHVFDLATEVGNRPEATQPVDHLAKGKTVTYNRRWWRQYPCNGDSTLVDGQRGGWNYNDYRWQGFLSHMDVTIDLEKVEPITYIGATFMQICGPDVYRPESVVISVSKDGESYEELKRIDMERVVDDEVTFTEFAWEGQSEARYVRYQADASSGVLFTDELIIK